MTDKRDTQISKTMSHALRHDPVAYNLKLAADGSVPVETLLLGLHGSHVEATIEDIERIVRESPKQRFVIEDGRIRAHYGHSTAERIEKRAVRPTGPLWHATSPEAAELIRRDGLLPMGRQYAHLTTERELALEAGRRKSPHPVLLEIDTTAALAAGVQFYEGHDRVTLADAVPAAFVRRVLDES